MGQIQGKTHRQVKTECNIEETENDNAIQR